MKALILPLLLCAFLTGCVRTHGTILSSAPQDAYGAVRVQGQDEQRLAWPVLLQTGMAPAAASGTP